MDAAQKFAIILVFMFGFFVFLGECSKMIKPEPVKPDSVYIHDTIYKSDSFAKPDTVYVHDTIYQTDSLFLETAEVQNLRKTIDHQNKIIKSLMRK